MRRDLQAMERVVAAGIPGQVRRHGASARGCYASSILAREDSFCMPESFLKKLDEICQPDPNQSFIHRFDSKTGQHRKKQFSDHYADVQSMAVSDYVPQDVRILFDTARNILLYAWFVWRFYAVAELYAYASLEFAIKLRAEIAGVQPSSIPKSLRPLMEFAISRGWIIPEDLPHYQLLSRNQERALERYEGIFDEEVARDWAPQIDPAGYREQLLRGIPGLRNEHAHGTTYISSASGSAVAQCGDIISMLFKGVNDAPDDAY
jgi:hypothetical protein